MGLLLLLLSSNSCSLRCLLLGVLLRIHLLCHHGVVPSQLEGTRLGRVRKVVLGREVHGLLLARVTQNPGNPVGGSGLRLIVVGHGQRQRQRMRAGMQLLIEAGDPMRQHRGVDHGWIALVGQLRLSAILLLLQQLVGQRGLGRIGSSTLKEKAFK